MKLALSTSGRNISSERFINYKNAGIEAMEISEGHIDGANAVDFPKIRAFITAFLTKNHILRTPWVFLFWLYNNLYFLSTKTIK